MKRRIIFLTIIFIFSVTSSAFCLNFRFAPLFIKAKAEPGEVINRTFTLSLKEEERETYFSSFIEDWWRSEDQRKTFYQPAGTLKSSCGTWCTVNPIEAAISGGETLSVRLTISVPPDVKPGGYWAALSVNELPSPLKPQGVAISFLASVSVGILVEVPPIEREAKIVGMRADEDFVWVKVKNLGNTMLKVAGKINFLAPGEEKILFTSELVSGASLPGEADPLVGGPINPLEFQAPLPADLPSGTYLLQAILDTDLKYYIGAEKILTIKGKNW